MISALKQSAKSKKEYIIKLYDALNKCTSGYSGTIIT